MTGFILSPGLTPELTDAVLLEFGVLLGVLLAWRGAEGAEIAVAANALLLGLIKLGTDFRDLGDLLVALAAILGGVFVLWGVLSERAPLPHYRRLEMLLGGVLVVVGLVKVVTDFYDPFDLFLAGLTITIGIWLILGRYGLRRASSALPLSRGHSL